MKCDRCKQTIPAATRFANGATGNFYDVTKEPWSKYRTAFTKEKNVCDDCMWKDPVYIADYGKVPK